MIIEWLKLILKAVIINITCTMLDKKDAPREIMDGIEEIYKETERLSFPDNNS